MSAPFFEPRPCRSRPQRVESAKILLGRGRDRLDLARREPTVVAGRGLADELADLLRVLGRDRLRQLDEDAAAQLAHFLERRQDGLLGPVREAATQVVVLVEVLLLAGAR